MLAKYADTYSTLKRLFSNDEYWLDPFIILCQTLNYKFIK